MKSIDSLIAELEKKKEKVFNDYLEIEWEEAKQNPDKQADKAYYDGIREGLSIAINELIEVHEQIKKNLEKV